MGFERAAIWALLRNPVLGVEALRAGWAMRKRGGLFPSEVYLRWRVATAYGDELTTTRGHDLVNYLEWRRGMRRIRRGSWKS